ncbi:MAG TPA: ABC transporter permease [Vicinamibacterales bacterium]|nr:ABC transporter permease [Vicinamibacterales bacterium]
MRDRLADRAYRALLLAFPPDIRRQSGDDMAALFRRQRRAAAQHPLGALRLWLLAGHDCLRHGLALRLGRGAVTQTCRRTTVTSRPHRRRLDFTRSGALIELRSTLRSLRRRPGLTILAVVTLALGIGASSAMYTVGRAVLLAPLPFGEPAGLVSIWTQRGGGELRAVAPREVLDLRERSQALADVAGWQADQVVLSAGGDAVRVPRSRVTANTFDVLGVRPRLGRAFAPAEGWPDRARVAILSDGLWRRELGADPNAVGTTISINGQTFEVIGVMPRGFHLPTDFGTDRPSQLWTPLDLNLEAIPRAAHFLSAVARVAGGASVEAAHAELVAISAALTAEGEYPEGDEFRVVSIPVERQILGAVTPVVLLLSGAAACLLLIACTNVAMLLITRADARRREVAVRQALGASVSRLLQAQLIEATVLALAGGALGIALAFGAGLVLEATGGSWVPRAGDAAVDWRVLAFTVSISIAVAFLCALPASWASVRRGPVDGLRSGSKLSRPLRQGISSQAVAVQLALAFVLLVGAGLMARTLWSYQRIDLGFRARGALTAQLVLPTASYDTPDRVTGYLRSLVDSVRELPGVDAAGVVRSIPIGSSTADWGIEVDGYAAQPDEPMQSDWQVVTDGAVEALGERLIAGRTLAAGDAAGSEAVGMINEAMARRFWPGRSALDGHFRMRAARDAPWVRVVGIIGDVRHNDLVSGVTPKFYLPYSQFFRSSGFSVTDGTLVLRTAGDPVGLAPAVVAAARRIDPGVPLSGIRTLEDIVVGALSTPRLAGAVLAAFSAVALLLAALGVYGLVAGLVAQRQQEIGIRLAVGAARSDVLAMVLRRGVGLALSGIAVGAVLAVVGTRALESLLFEVTALDPATYGAVSIVLLSVTLLGCGFPAWRAARIDPLSTLRDG